MRGTTGRTELQAVAPSAFIRAAGSGGAEPLGQLLFGERFVADDERDGWVRGCAVRDGCAGWIPAAALGEPTRPTHRVRSLSASACPVTSGPASGALPLNALVAATEAKEGFVLDPSMGWLAEGDLSPIGRGFERDAAAVALQYLGTPYKTGARDGTGLDAPGLVQQALYACGLGCPRAWSELARLGRPVGGGDPPRRGDLAVWTNHAGLMEDAERLIHADPTHRLVRREPLADVAARLEEQPALRRL